MTLTNKQIERVLFQLKGIVTPTWYERQAAEGLTELLALRAEVERLKRPEVVLAEAERLLREASDTPIDGYFEVTFHCDVVDVDIHSFAGTDANGATLPEAFAKLQEARRGE